MEEDRCVGMVVVVFRGVREGLPRRGHWCRELRELDSGVHGQSPVGQQVGLPQCLTRRALPPGGNPGIEVLVLLRQIVQFY